MPRASNDFRRSLLLDLRFICPAILGSVLMIVATFGPISLPLALLGCLFSIAAGLLLAYLGRQTDREPARAADAPPALASDPELLRFYQSVCEALTNVARLSDEGVRNAAVRKLSTLNTEIAGLASSRVVFTATESWRAVYAALLASPLLKEHRAVAWVRSKDYWQDGPGRQSTRANLDAVHRGVLIERLVILPDSLWPAGQHLPSNDIRPWIEEQHNHGLRMILVRERDLGAEPDLVADAGLFDERAVAVQELDERAQTVRFTLDFGPEAVRQAVERWRRLSRYGISFRELLDRADTGG